MKSYRSSAASHILYARNGCRFVVKTSDELRNVLVVEQKLSSRKQMRGDTFGGLISCGSYASP